MLVIFPPLNGLFPRLDLDRQRLNMERRFDWSYPPPEENIALRDIGQPDWIAYLEKLKELEADEVCP